MNSKRGGLGVKGWEDSKKKILTRKKKKRRNRCSYALTEKENRLNSKKKVIKKEGEDQKETGGGKWRLKKGSETRSTLLVPIEMRPSREGGADQERS